MVGMVGKKAKEAPRDWVLHNGCVLCLMLDGPDMQKYFRLTVSSVIPSVGWTLDGEATVIEGIWLSCRLRMSIDIAKTGSYLPVRSQAARLLRHPRQRVYPAVVSRLQSHRQTAGLTPAAGAERGE